MNKQGFIIALVVVVIGLFFLGASPLFTVDITQNAIVVQLGKPVRNLTEPGLYVKVPFIQEVTYFDKRLLDYDSDAQDVITQTRRPSFLTTTPNGGLSTPSRSIRTFKPNGERCNGSTILSILNSGSNSGAMTFWRSSRITAPIS
jgi:Membrane protease subunits, stomatin/prohibitin homologs